jgi:hypothetical protein
LPQVIWSKAPGWGAACTIGSFWVTIWLLLLPLLLLLLLLLLGPWGNQLPKVIWSRVPGWGAAADACAIGLGLGVAKRLLLLLWLQLWLRLLSILGRWRRFLLLAHQNLQEAVEPCTSHTL